MSDNKAPSAIDENFRNELAKAMTEAFAWKAGNSEIEADTPLEFMIKYLESLPAPSIKEDQQPSYCHAIKMGESKELCVYPACHCKDQQPSGDVEWINKIKSLVDELPVDWTGTGDPKEGDKQYADWQRRWDKLLNTQPIKEDTPARYSCEKIEDNKSYVWHTEGNTKTLIAITDNLEKAHFLAAAANQFDYDRYENKVKEDTPIDETKK